MVKYRVCCFLFYVLASLLQRCSSDIETIESGPIKMWSLGKALAGKLSRGGLWNIKTFHTCGIGEEVDFVLLLKPVSFVNFTTDVVYVDVQASFQMCHSAEGKSTDCTSNDFEVYVYRGNNTGIAEKFTKKEFPSLLAHNFTLIYNITGYLDGTITNSTFTFSQNGATVVMFVIRSRGACGTLHHVSMYYYFCPKIYFNSVKFNKTSSPASGSTKVLGDCSRNAKPSDRGQTTMKGYCYSNCTWNIDPTVKCLCMAGYEPNKILGCALCNPGYFKNNISNRECGRCPLNSKSIRNATDCGCKYGFYNFTFGSDCYVPDNRTTVVRTTTLSKDARTTIKATMSTTNYWEHFVIAVSLCILLFLAIMGFLAVWCTKRLRSHGQETQESDVELDRDIPAYEVPVEPQHRHDRESEADIPHVFPQPHYADLQNRDGQDENHIYQHLAGSAHGEQSSNYDDARNSRTYEELVNE